MRSDLFRNKRGDISLPKISLFVLGLFVLIGFIYLTSALEEISTVTLNSTSGRNYIDDNLTAWVSPLNVSQNYIYNWTLNDKKYPATPSSINFSKVVLKLLFNEYTQSSDKLKDYSGYNNDGVNTGSVWNSTGGYDGSGSYHVNAAAANIMTSLEKSDLGAFSFGGWIKEDVASSSSLFGFLHSTNRFKLHTDGSYFTLWDTTSIILTTNGTTNANWHHLFVTRDYLNNVKVYKDGSLIGEMIYPGVIEGSFGIGGDAVGNWHATVEFDNIMVFNISLTQSQISDLYNDRGGNLIFSDETSLGDVWSVFATPNNGTTDGASVLSNNITILDWGYSSVLLNSSFGANTTTENLTAYALGLEGNSSAIVASIYDWRKDGSSVLGLNLNMKSSTLRDYSLNNYTLVSINGGPTYNSTGGHDGKGGYEFNNAAAKYLQLNSNSYLDFGHDDSFTMSAWVKTTDASYRYIILKSISNTGYMLQMKNDYKVRIGLTDFVNAKYDFIEGTTLINDNVWHHIVGVRDAVTRNVSIYVDGVLEGYGDDTTITTSTASPLMIGSNGGAYTWGGGIENVQIFNRALTTEQIQAMYNDRPGLIVSQETSLGEVWSVSVTSNNGTTDGASVLSNNITILDWGYSSVLLNSSFGTNYSNENLTAYALGLVGNSSAVTNTYGWYKNGTDVTESIFPIYNSLSSGYAHTCGFIEGGAAYCWGLDNQQQLGDGNVDLVDEHTPSLVAGGHAFKSISSGYSHSCGLTENGAVYCWGDNTYLQLGNGASGGAEHTPTLVAGGHVFKSISSGYFHSCGLLENGTAYCWGYDDLGQLGNGAIIGNQHIPSLVVGGQTFKSLVLGDAHSCGLTEAGVAYCWGYDAQQQLGNGNSDIANVNSPGLVVGGHTFKSLAIDGYHSCGLTEAGVAYCWGYDASGQLGNGAITGNQHTPTPVVGGHTFKSIATGYGHSCGLLENGSAYCWGRDNKQQVGNGDSDIINVDAPTLVVGNHTFKSISLGIQYSCGVIGGGAAYCWGVDNRQQLGDGNVDIVDEHTPSLVAGSYKFDVDNSPSVLPFNKISIGDVWSVSVTPNDGIADGRASVSNNLTILNWGYSSVLLNSSFGTNYSNENLTAYAFGLAGNSSAVNNTYDWYKNGVLATGYIGDSNLVAGFSFNKLSNHSFAYDESLLHSNATGYGVTYNSTGGQDGKGSYNFPGDGSSIRIPYQTTFSGQGNISVSMWAKIPSNYNIPSSGGGGNAGGYLITFSDTAYDWNIELDGNNNVFFDNGGGIRISKSGLPNFNDDTWHHYVATSNDADNITRFYLDGVEIMNSTAPFTKDAITGKLNIGARRLYGSSFSIKAEIDDVFVFNKILTPQDVLDLNASEYFSATSVLSSSKTSGGEVWAVSITPNDGSDGLSSMSNNITIESFPLDLPNYTNFSLDYGTTNFLNEINMSNITGLTLGAQYGKIEFPESYSVNAAYENYNDNITIGEVFISVNSAGLHSSFNSSTNITLNNADCINKIVYYGGSTYLNRTTIINEDNVCNATTSPACTNVVCSGNNLTFTAEQFSGYASNAFANLTIWDGNDTGMLYGDQNASLNSDIKFFANYTNISSEVILDADCGIWFNDNGWNNMSFNASANIYDYNRSFSTGGNITWNISCKKDGFGTLNINDSIELISEGCPSTPQNWVVDMSEYLVVNEMCNLTGYNITFNGIGNFTVNSTIYVDKINNLTSGMAVWMKPAGTIWVGKV